MALIFLLKEALSGKPQRRHVAIRYPGALKYVMLMTLRDISKDRLWT